MAGNGAGRLRGRGSWLAWLLGAALLASVVAGALHFSEERAFVRLAEQAEPWWLAVAVLLQAGTYLAQGEIWRRVAAASGNPLPRTAAFELSLAKLFADQALPSAGLSSSILIAQALEQRRLPPGAVKASVLANITSYHLAYALALLVAVGIVFVRGDVNAVILAATALFPCCRAIGSRAGRCRRGPGGSAAYRDVQQHAAPLH